MEDQELKELKELKAQLLEKASNLLSKLKNQEENKRVIKIKESNVKKNVNTVKEELPENYEKLSFLSKQVSGIAFENIDRKWLQDNNYKYTTSLISETLSVDIELIVKLEDNDKSEVCDLVCNFRDLRQWNKPEVESWSKYVIKKKNFSLLTSAISQYNDQNLIRRKLLDKLKAEKYVSYEECLNKHGGIFIHVHSPRNVAREYLTFQWVIAFTEWSWEFENHFNIGAIETGNKSKHDRVCETIPISKSSSEVEFVQRNSTLLENFVQKNMTKEELADSWSKLCLAIDSYENGE